MEDAGAELGVGEEFAESEAHGDFVDAGFFDVAGDGEDAGAFPAVGTGIGVGFAGAGDDERGPGESFDIADEGGEIEEAIGLEFGGNIAGFASAIGHGLDEGGLFAADVAAWGGEDGDGEGATEDIGGISAEAEGFGAKDFGLAGGDLFVVFVADVDEALGGFGEQAGEDDAFDDQMGEAEEEFAIFESAWLAFVAVDDDEGAIVFFSAAGDADGVADIAPFLDGGNARAAHAAEVPGFEFFEEGIGPAAEGRSLSPSGFSLPIEDRIIDGGVGDLAMIGLADGGAAEGFEATEGPGGLGVEESGGGGERGIAGGEGLANGEIIGSFSRVRIDAPEGGIDGEIGIVIGVGESAGGDGLGDGGAEIFGGAGEEIMVVAAVFEGEGDGGGAIAATEAGDALDGDGVA